jgi:nucleotide-binding universal stress UspA family protein
MYERVLHPTDGSTGTAHVTLQAIDLAEQYGATVHGVHVIDTDLTSILSEGGRDRDGLESRADTVVKNVERMADAHGVPVETDILEGDPAEQILDYADEIDADVIVSGTHGRSGVKRQLLGSVAERLVRHSDVPVLTVQLPETDVTVEDNDHAAEIVAKTLESEGYDAEVTGVEHQQNVWVAHASTGDGELVVYLDPRTQRTSVVSA